MDTSHHGQHLVQLTRLKMSNCYLVREDDGLTLIDTSIPGSADAILRAAEEVGGGPVRRIVITHAHNDHYGSLDALRKRLPDAEVLISARDAKLMAGDRSREPGEPEGRLFPLFFTPARTRPTRTVAEGDRIGSLEVYDAPGHTPGQIALVDTRDGTMHCGDAYLALRGLYVTTKPAWPFPLPALVGTWHKPTAWETARKLRDMEPSRLATGHGPVVEDPVPRMAQALAEAPRS